MIEPYGGKLVEQVVDQARKENLMNEAHELPLLHPYIDQVYDAEKIAIGAYSPLEGFMNREDFTSVIERGRLASGLPWTMPVFLTPQGKKEQELIERAGDSDVFLLADGQNRIFARFTFEDRYRLQKDLIAREIFGTADSSHPNVSDLQRIGDVAAGGRVELIDRLSDSPFELTPSETRERFRKLGWESVAGYQARNPPHAAHEYIQRITLERDDVDGLLIHPIIGKLKKGDYRSSVIMDAYSVFVRSYYRADRVLLASLSISMRYAGPKAVLFYAIIRRNYGCSHYIVGRDQAGVGSYYDPYAGHRILDQFDVGVKAIRYDEIFYCRKCMGMTSRKICPHAEEFHESTSQTRIRKLLAEGKPLPEEILRPEVADVLKSGDVIEG